MISKQEKAKHLCSLFTVIFGLILGVMICLSFTGCANTFEKEKAALNDTKWFSAAETSNSVVVWDFFEESVQRSRYFFDGNGIHDSDKDTAEYEFQKDVIKVTFADDEILIPYTFENNEIHLERGKYFSVQDIEDGIQGCWTVHQKIIFQQSKHQQKRNTIFNSMPEQ